MSKKIDEQEQELSMDQVRAIIEKLDKGMVFEALYDAKTLSVTEAADKVKRFGRKPSKAMLDDYAAKRPGKVL